MLKAKMLEWELRKARFKRRSVPSVVACNPGGSSKGVGTRTPRSTRPWFCNELRGKDVLPARRPWFTWWKRSVYVRELVYVRENILRGETDSPT